MLGKVRMAVPETLSRMFSERIGILSWVNLALMVWGGIQG